MGVLFRASRGSWEKDRGFWGLAILRQCTGTKFKEVLQRINLRRGRDVDKGAVRGGRSSAVGNRRHTSQLIILGLFSHTCDPLRSRILKYEISTIFLKKFVFVLDNKANMLYNRQCKEGQPFTKGGRTWKK